jgi:hypothetical protein
MLTCARPNRLAKSSANSYSKPPVGWDADPSQNPGSGTSLVTTVSVPACRAVKLPDALTPDPHAANVSTNDETIAIPRAAEDTFLRASERADATAIRLPTAGDECAHPFWVGCPLGGRVGSVRGTHGSPMLFLLRPRQTRIPLARTRDRTHQDAYNAHLQQAYASTRRVAPAAPEASAAPRRDPVAELKELAELHRSGMLTDAELALAKARVLPVDGDST